MLVQIVLLDIVFSLDSVLTAVGHGRRDPDHDRGRRHRGRRDAVRVGPLSRFVHAHPSVKMLALSFLLLIGVTLIADGFGFHIDKAYIYAAMGFSVFVEGAQPPAAEQAPGGAAPDVRAGRAGPAAPPRPACR